MTEPKCDTCEDQGFLICGNCNAYDNVVTIRRDELALLLNKFHDGTAKEWAVYDRLRAALKTVTPNL